MNTARRLRALLLGASALALLGCDGGEDAGGASSTSTDPPSSTAAVAATTDPAVETTTPAAAWQQVFPGGDCECADGSEYSFWVRPAAPEKVVLFFQGGGACFSAETCSFSQGTYKTTTGSADDPSNAEGIFDFSAARNPLADYSFVYVPYCTGDVHIGNAITEYSPELTVHHVGSRNADAAVDHLVATFPDATDVLVTGESAGSVPSPLYAGVVADRLPDADVAVLADGSGAYPDVPGINALIGQIWGTVAAMPDWPENAGMTAETWSFPGLFVQAGRHDPSITFARHDYAFDSTQVFFASLAGIPADDLVTLIDANEAQIEAAGVPLASFIAPGGSHTVLSQDGVYTEEVDGVALVEWVTDLVTDEPVDDVHCTQCRT